MPSVDIAGIILAAGKGTRMKSALPKGLFEVCGIPMAELAGRAMREVGIERPIMVIGHGRDQMEETLGDRYMYAVQDEQHGTGHAVQIAAPLLSCHDGPVLVVPGDAPLISGDDLKKLLELHLARNAKCTVATVTVPDATGYGRVLRDSSGNIVSIVEHKDADEVTRRTLCEINTAVYCFDCKTLVGLLPRLGNDNAQREYYLTDLIEMIAKEGEHVEGCLFSDPQSFMGINDRWQLAQAASILRQRVLREHALAGVTIVDPATTYIGLEVEIGEDTTVAPMTSISGLTRIGRDCQIGPSSDINDCDIGDGCLVLMSRLDHSIMKNGAKCGPFAHLRSGAVIGERAKIGNYVEVKKSEFGEKASAAHLAYIGDSTVGAGTNVGAGTITCNYDGFSKNRTEIGANAFIGSNSTLIAPVTIGEGAFIAAGSVINKDVPPNAMAIGRGRQEVKEEWAEQWRQRKKAEKKSTAS